MRTTNSVPGSHCQSNRALRDYHYHKQNGLCAYCDVEMDATVTKQPETPKANSVTLEHVIPRSLGGRNIDYETLAICYHCNQTRSNFPLPVDLLFRVFVINGVDSIPVIVFNLQTLLKETVSVFIGKHCWIGRLI